MKDSALPANPLDVDQAGAATSDPVTIPLTERGRHQAEQIARWHWRKPTLIVVSPYDRTRGTAVPLVAQSPDVLVEEWPDLSGAGAVRGHDRS